MLLYQYAYYWMIEWDKWSWKRRLAESTSMCRVLVVFSVIESFGLAAVYALIFNVILGVDDSNYTPNAFLILVLLIFYSSCILLFNRWLLGPKERVEHYRKIFQTWDKQKLMRWKLYLIFISVLCILSFALLVKPRHLPNPGQLSESRRWEKGSRHLFSSPRSQVSLGNALAEAISLPIPLPFLISPKTLIFLG